jgi:hypothetical protein
MAGLHIFRRVGLTHLVLLDVVATMLKWWGAGENIAERFVAEEAE